MLKTPQTAHHTASTAPRCDRFGNVLDLKVGYARSLVITGEVAEAQRQQRAYAIVHERFARVAVAGEDFLEIALRRTRRNATVLVPIEAVVFASMKMLESHGAVMIPAVGMPGAACTFRLMMYPGGERNILDAWRLGMDALCGALDDADQVRAVLWGSDTALRGL